ncbi:MAG TPA: hypothetical protein VJ935_08875 [Acidimicrobiia bacterium]|nr:hypothetical protein [Acidimicrobiia bacterium]
MRDVVVDCDVVAHTMNEGAGEPYRAATRFISALVESTTQICLDEAGFILSEYSERGLTTSHHDLVQQFIKHLVRPGLQCVIAEDCLTAAQRQAIGHLPIDQHDKRYVRITACAVERWLVSNDGTYDGNADAVRDAAGVDVEHSREATVRLIN